VLLLGLAMAVRLRYGRGATRNLTAATLPLMSAGLAGCVHVLAADDAGLAPAVIVVAGLAPLRRDAWMPP
jgi:hypothetical protein